MSEPYSNAMDQFSFDYEQPSATNTMAPYNLAMLSPTTSEHDSLFPKIEGYEYRTLHVNPAVMWGGAGNPSSSEDMFRSLTDSARRSAGLGKLLTGFDGHANQVFGQITPPGDKNELENSLDKRADSAVSNSHGSKSGSQHTLGSPSKKRKLTTSASPKRARKLDHDSADEEEEEDEDESGEKKGKYREKNRVAAAKCRAKKKEHIDHLEENHRTHSALNVALKQTEKSLRDQLSYWRTQALQHSHCNCRPIQDYNMRKAQALADESNFGGRNWAKANSPIITSSNSLDSPSQGPNGLRAFRSQSMAVPKPSPTKANKTRKPFDPASNSAAFQSQGHNHGHSRNASDSVLVNRLLSMSAEQELKNFVDDVTER